MGIEARGFLATVLFAGSLTPWAAGGGASEDADRQAVRKASEAFAQAFAKGDAKAVAAFWTEQGEYHTDGVAVRGRSAIEEGFAQHFKTRPGHKIAVQIESIRFPSANVAIEEGLLRNLGGGRELPTSSLYSVTHVRDGGSWKIAVAREWGGSDDRLADLDWLVGKWKGTVKDQEATLTFAWDAKKPLLIGEFEKSVQGKVVGTGTMKIGVDPQRPGQLRSWHFDDDGGHGQALWFRDGTRWVLDAKGVSGRGANTASVNLLSRLSHDAFVWRSIDRVVAGQALPDTTPIKLTRVPSSK